MVGVVGGGVMGLATACALSARGWGVILLERHRVGHPAGSSGGPARAFAVPHGQQHLIGMAARALPAWKDIDTAAGGDVLDFRGAMLRAQASAKVHEQVLREGLESALLDSRAVASRFGVALGEGPDVVWSPDGGTIRADRAVEALRRIATAQGVEIREGWRVSALQVDEGSGVRIGLANSDSDLEVDAVVVAAGRWTPELITPQHGPLAGIDVTPSRQTVTYFRVENAEEIPALYEDGDPPVYWVASGKHEIRAGAHEHKNVADDPDELGEPDEGVVNLIRDRLARRLAKWAPVFDRAETCFYTQTPDEQFVMQRHGAVALCIACNGRGFKFAPLIGEKMADLAEESLKELGHM